jgi:hypothetical protein
MTCVLEEENEEVKGEKEESSKIETKLILNS